MSLQNNGLSSSTNSRSVYNDHAGVSNPTSCTVPSAPPSGTGNNGNGMGYFYQDGANSSFGHTTSYSYDHLNRLGTSVATGSSTHNLTFSYDRYGNMTCVTNGNTNGPCPNWTFNTSTNQILNSGFTYDAAGDLTGDGTHTYQWNAEGRLKSVDNGNTATYVYNALGWRVEKKVGSAYTEVLYDQSGESLGENNRTTWTQSYVNFAGRHLAIYANNSTYFTHPNSLGSTVMVSDYTGAIVEDKLFYPWGQDWQAAGTLYEERFAKLQHRDSETSLDATPNRMFSSTFGRWLSPDPVQGGVSSPQSLNRYAYALNNPCSLTDPLGLASCNFNIKINNKTGGNLDLNAIEAQINAIFQLSSQGQPNSVGASFISTGNADYTLNVVSGSGPGGALGAQNYLLGLWFLPGATNVYAGAIASTFSNAPSAINQVMGTVGAHELTHRITGIGDLQYTGGSNGVPNLMQINSYTSQYGPQATALYLQPNALLLSASQVSALYNKCTNRYPGGNPAGGGQGGINAHPPGWGIASAGWSPLDWFLWGSNCINGGGCPGDTGDPTATVTVTQTICDPGVNCVGE